jgi:hypothetical protein
VAGSYFFYSPVVQVPVERTPYFSITTVELRRLYPLTHEMKRKNSKFFKNLFSATMLYLKIINFYDSLGLLPWTL